MFSFPISPVLVTPKQNLSIFLSATSSSASCCFLTVSKPNIAGLTTALYTFLCIVAETLPSLHTPDNILQPFQPAFSCFFTSFPQSPWPWTVDPRYLESSIFFVSYNLTPPSLACTPSCCGYLHSSPFQGKPSLLQLLLHLFPALGTYHNVIQE